MPELIPLLKRLAAQNSPSCDDKEFNAYDYCGGNYDDAWYGGVSDGETQLARKVLTNMGLTWN